MRLLESHSTSWRDGGKEGNEKLGCEIGACYSWSYGLRPKSLMLLWRCHHLQSDFLANGHLSRVSRQSDNDKDGNEVKPGAVHRSPGD